MFNFTKSVSQSVSKSTRSLKLLRSAAILAGALGIAVLSLQLAPATSANAATGLHYQRGNYLTNGWYCYGWSNGVYHCTKRWHRSGSRIISDTSFVPNGGSAATIKKSSTSSSKTYSGPVTHQTGGRNPYPWGQCTWYARSRGGSELNGLGMARDWAWKARAKGLPVGRSPRVGSTAVFLPHVQTVSSLGHVAHVEKVYSNGTFLVSDMNWSGVGRITYHVMHTGAGVYFIY